MTESTTNPQGPFPEKGILLTQFLTVNDQARSRAFYSDILGGKVIRKESPCMIQLANTWVILNDGGGPTPDKPEVHLAPPSDTNRVSSFMNIRVADIQQCYSDWKSRGAEFITEPLDNHGYEMRCYMRDPDGYIIEVGQASEMMKEAIRNG